MPPGYVKAYVKRNKNDGRDAEAICEAVAGRRCDVHKSVGAGALSPAPGRSVPRRSRIPLRTDAERTRIRCAAQGVTKASPLLMPRSSDTERLADRLRVHARRSCCASRKPSRSPAGISEPGAHSGR